MLRPARKKINVVVSLGFTARSPPDYKIDFMKTKGLACIIVSLAWSSIAAPLPPNGFYRLTMEEVVNTGHCQVLNLKIEARPTAEMMALEMEGRGSGSCRLSGNPKSKIRDGKLVLVAMRTDRESPVETTTALQSEGGGTFATFPASYDAPPDARVETLFSLSVTNGLYELNRPLVIGKRNGEPIRFVVGRWNWEQLSQVK